MVRIERLDDEGRVDELVALINRAYAAGERGLWREGTPRTDVGEIAAAVRAGELLVARGADGAIRGCARVRPVAADSAEVGLVASATQRRGTGVGRELMRAAEERMHSRGHTTMRLWLLVPRSGTHPDKERLRAWYERLGYRAVDRVPFEAVVPQAAAELALPCDLIAFKKPLPEPGAVSPD